MNTLPTLATKNYSLPNASALPFAGASRTQLLNKPLTSNLAPSPGDLVSLSKQGMALSKQKDMMADRVEDLGSAAVDMAQKFLTAFAQSVLGDAADGMTVSFDSASVSASSSFQGSVQHSEGPDGVRDASAFSLEDNASFTGKGVITTADGRRFNFEVEVQYQAIAQSTASQTTTSQTSSAPKPAPLDMNARQPIENAPTENMPKERAPKRDMFVDFPGTVKDLFKMMDHQNKMTMSFGLPSAEFGDGKARQGKLMLQLLDMIESPKTVNAKLAKAYGVPEVSALSAPAASTVGSAASETTTTTSPSSDTPQV